MEKVGSLRKALFFNFSHSHHDVILSLPGRRSSFFFVVGISRVAGRKQLFFMLHVALFLSSECLRVLIKHLELRLMHADFGRLLHNYFVHFYLPVKLILERRRIVQLKLRDLSFGRRQAPIHRLGLLA